MRMVKSVLCAYDFGDMKKYFLVLFVALFLTIHAQTVKAGECYTDPVHAYSGIGVIQSAVFLRDHACMTGSVILATVPSGARVDVIGYTDGWYRIEWNGGRGWIGQQFLGTSAQKTGVLWNSYHAHMADYPSRGPAVIITQSAKTDLLARVRGYILLQVQGHGEAWYVDPITDRRYYMKDGPTAYQMMRSFGLGISEGDYARMAAGDWALKSRLRGRIVLRVQEHGEAYYIHPKDLTVHYLKNGDEAYRIMRLYSLGITDADLGALEVSAVPVK